MGVNFISEVVKIASSADELFKGRNCGRILAGGTDRTTAFKNSFAQFSKEKVCVQIMFFKIVFGFKTSPSLTWSNF